MNIVAFSNNTNQIFEWEKKLPNYTFNNLLPLNGLYSYRNTIALIDVTSYYGNIINIIEEVKKLNIKILLLEENPSLKKEKEYLKLGISGYGDLNMDSEYLSSAIQTIKNGIIWLYPEF